LIVRRPKRRSNDDSTDRRPQKCYLSLSLEIARDVIVNSAYKTARWKCNRKKRW
jgi:hypothetical protein